MRITLYQLRQLINAYDKEEISLSRFCEILNQEGQPNHINDYGKQPKSSAKESDCEPLNNGLTSQTKHD